MKRTEVFCAHFSVCHFSVIHVLSARRPVIGGKVFLVNGKAVVPSPCLRAEAWDLSACNAQAGVSWSDISGKRQFAATNARRFMRRGWRHRVGLEIHPFRKS
jgi:hypothetical protein